MPEQALFDYDSSAPLDVNVVARERRDSAEVTEIRYANGTGGGAAAFVVAPAERPHDQLPGVVIAHGGSAPGKHLFLAEALELGRSGTIVLLADTSFPPLGDAASEERAFVAAVLVQRRGLDVLVHLHGASPLGYYGHSFGGTQGAILSAVEPRLEAIVIAAMGTGIARWAREQGFDDPRYLEAIDRFDPVHYVAVPGSRRLLFQYGREDEVISRAAARTLYEAAAEPKTWREYDCGHGGVTVHEPARVDRVAFFRDRLHAR